MFRRKNKSKTEEESTANHDGTEHETGGKKKKSKFYERFAQQELWGWSPIITGNVVVIYFMLVTVVCIALGVPILVASIKVKEVKARYDNTGVMSGKSSSEAERLVMAGNVAYPVTMQIPQTMQPPVSYTIHTATDGSPSTSRKSPMRCVKCLNLLTHSTLHRGH